MQWALHVAASGGFWLVFRSSKEPMWRPTLTRSTVQDRPQEDHLRERLGALLADFAVNAALVTAAGAVIAYTTGNIVEETGGERDRRGSGALGSRHLPA